MVGITGSVLPPVLQRQLQALTRTARSLDDVQLQLATGRQVNSALDDPRNFFSAQDITYRANDLSRLLDGVGQSIRTIQTALAGVNAIGRLLDQAEAIALETRQELTSGVAYPDLTFIEEEYTNVTGPTIRQEILSDNPVGYWKLNDVSGTTATNLGSGGAAIDGTYQNSVSLGQSALYTNEGGNSDSALFNGTNQRVNIPDSNLINTAVHAQRTVELVFNANDIVSRQILYEEGAAVNGFTIYIDNGLIRVTGEDDNGAGTWYDADISAAINVGETYHIAFVFDQPSNSFTGYLNGVDIGSVSVANSTFPSHSGNIAIGAMNDGAQFHDGESSAANGYFYDGYISDVALYNTALTQADLQRHYDALDIDTAINYVNTEFDTVLSQIDNIVEDANYRGVNLLENDDLTTYFNEDGSNFLKTEGTDFSYSGLGIKRYDFNDENDLDDIIESIRSAREDVRAFGRTLSSDFSIIQTRETHTRETINTLKAGADDLVVADQNEKGAEFLALQTRQLIQFQSLAFQRITLTVADILA